MLTIIRGPSGTGKSTIAKYFGGIERENWFEADMYFVDPKTREYNFNPQSLGSAHKWCQDSVREVLTSGKDAIVSNTTIRWTELNDYLKIARETNTAVRIIATPGPWLVISCSTRNTHGVPIAVLERQIENYAPHESESQWADMSIFD